LLGIVTNAVQQPTSVEGAYGYGRSKSNNGYGYGYGYGGNSSRTTYEYYNNQSDHDDADNHNTDNNDADNNNAAISQPLSQVRDTTNPNQNAGPSLAWKQKLTKYARQAVRWIDR
jgi:hypothetical protein